MDSLLFDAVFNRASSYRNLSFCPETEAPRSVHEAAPGHSFGLTERHLQCAWYDPAIRPHQLMTSDGQPVTILEPGRWNMEAGPDFLDAVISAGTDAAVLKGDIEIHFDPSDWSGHGHKSDPAYEHVIAHVCYRAGPPPRELPPACIQIDFGKALQQSGHFYPEDIDVAAYPHSLPGLPHRKCSNAFRELSFEEQMNVLCCAGYERLRLKAQRMRRAMDRAQPTQVLYEEVMSSLGYKHNRSQFRRVAATLSLEELRETSQGDPAAGHAMLLGTAGLLPHTVANSADDETRTLIRNLWNFWWKQESGLADRIPAKIEWKLSSMRPTNHPVRRMAAAACLFCRIPSVPEQLLSLADQKEISVESISCLLTDTQDIPYWQTRFSFGGKKQATAVSLLGPGRVSVIIINVVLPFLAAAGKDVSHLLDQLPQENFNTVTRQMIGSLIGGDYNPAKYQHALIQQGLIQIFNDYCLGSSNTCDNCIFAEALSNAVVHAKTCKSSKIVP